MRWFIKRKQSAQSAFLLVLVEADVEITIQSKSDGILGVVVLEVKQLGLSSWNRFVCISATDEEERSKYAW